MNEPNYSMYSEAGNRAVDREVRKDYPRDMQVADRVSQIQRVVLMQGHREVHDTAVREALYAALEQGPPETWEKGRDAAMADHEAQQEKAPRETMRRAWVATELEAEVAKRDQWYGLDNWPVREVVDFVVDRYEQAGVDPLNLPHGPRQS